MMKIMMRKASLMRLMVMLMLMLMLFPFANRFMRRIVRHDRTVNSSARLVRRPQAASTNLPCSFSSINIMRRKKCKPNPRLSYVSSVSSQSHALGRFCDVVLRCLLALHSSCRLSTCRSLPSETAQARETKAPVVCGM